MPRMQKGGLKPLVQMKALGMQVQPIDAPTIDHLHAIQVQQSSWFENGAVTLM